MSGRRNTSKPKTFSTSLVDWMAQGVVRNTAEIIPSIEQRKAASTGGWLYPPIHGDAGSRSMPWRLHCHVNDATLGRTVSAAAVITPSLNGLPWPSSPGVPTQAQVDAQAGNKVKQGELLAQVLNAMEIQYPVAGKVEDSKNVMTPSTATAIAVQTAGTMSLPNTSGQHLVVGAVVQFRLPVPEAYAGTPVPGHPPLMNPVRGMTGVASYQLYCPSRGEMFEPGHALVEREEKAALAAGGSGGAYVDGVLGQAMRVLRPLMRSGIIKWGDAAVGSAGQSAAVVLGAALAGGAVANLSRGGIRGAIEASAAVATNTGTATNVAGLSALIGPGSKGTDAGRDARTAIAELLLDETKSKVLDTDGGFTPSQRVAENRFTERASGSAAGGYARSTNPPGRMIAKVIASGGIQSGVRIQVQ